MIKIDYKYCLPIFTFTGFLCRSQSYKKSEPYYTSDEIEYSVYSNQNKYFNLDVNWAYFIPLNTFSYTLRGFKLNASLNFSF